MYRRYFEKRWVVFSFDIRLEYWVLLPMIMIYSKCRPMVNIAFLCFVITIDFPMGRIVAVRRKFKDDQPD